MTYRIRQITSSQIADLIRIADETNLSPWSAQNYLDELQTQTSIMMALIDDRAQTIGFIVGRLVPGAAENVVDAEIYNIAVIASEQGHGHGQSLFDAFLAKCTASHAANIWLEVRESNQKAIDFYRRNAFESVQTRRDFYQDPRENGIIMRLCLEDKRLDNSLE